MEEEKRQFTNGKTFLFVIVLCFTCALILSVLADVLKKPQFDARALYKSYQLLRSAAILSDENVLLLDGQWAVYDGEKGILVPSSSKKKVKNHVVLSLFETRILERVVGKSGEIFTFEEADLDRETYLEANAKYGYAHLDFKLIYIIQPNLPPELLNRATPPYGYVIPINGYGLWDAIYGYLGLEANANTAFGMTWYDQKETPGLGGNIALPKWQGQFRGKEVFQSIAPSGQTDFNRAQLGIKVVKTTVRETYGETPLSASAVDGIPGASITVMGVNEALRNSLEPYRPFLVRAHEQFLKGERR